MEQPNYRLTARLWRDSAKQTRRVQHFACVFFGLLLWAGGSHATDSDHRTLIGTWDGTDRASQARYGRIRLTEKSIQWSGSRANPGCRVRYTLVTSSLERSYPDELLSNTLPVPPGPTDVLLAAPANPPVTVPLTDIQPEFSVFRLALQKRRCTGQRSALQFAIPTTAPNQAELITYDRQGKAVSWGHLARVKN